MHKLFILILLGCALVSNVWAQSGKNKRQPTKAAPFFDEADALFGKRKVKNSAHDKYANQEVSYRKRNPKNTKSQAAVFEPNDEPLWVQKNKRRKQVQNRAKNQDIEVENDETHRTRTRATRTETVNNNESLRTAKTRRRKN